MDNASFRVTVGLSALIAITFASGCTKPAKTPQMAKLYSRAAADHVGRNPIIVIPGVLGSYLEQSGTGTLVWGAFGGGAANPETAEGARLAALPMEIGAQLGQLRDDVVATRVLDSVTVQLLFVPLELSAYRNILITLGAGGYRDQTIGEAVGIFPEDHFTCFQFAYDWRRDIVENAKLLDDFIKEKSDEINEKMHGPDKSKHTEIRFDIAAHSMGGLLARYYLRYGAADLPQDGSDPPAPTWAGAEHVDRLLMIGTPNAGSTKALRELVQGVRLALIVPKYHAAVLGTMPALYQLLPRDRHAVLVDSESGEHLRGLYDVEFWSANQWGLLNPNQAKYLERLLPDVEDAEERRRIAYDHVAKCLRRAEQFHAALDSENSPPEHVELHLFAGDAEQTLAVLAVDLETGRISTHECRPGDGTVLRTSALMDEREVKPEPEPWPRLHTPIDFTSVRFIFSDHLGITKDPSFSDDALFILLEAPR